MVPASGTCRPCMHADIVNRTNLDWNWSDVSSFTGVSACVPGMHTTREAGLPPTTVVRNGGKGAGISAGQAPNTVKLSDTLWAEDFCSFTVLATSSPSWRNLMKSVQKNPHYREDAESAAPLSTLVQRRYLWQDALLVIVPPFLPRHPTLAIAASSGVLKGSPAHLHDIRSVRPQT